VLRYTIKQGDHLSALAERHGFERFEAIWDHPDNAELKQLRKNPSVLFPGDEITIPDREPKTVEVPSTALHRFVLHRSRLALRLTVLDCSGHPRSEAPCTLAVEGDASDLVTSGEGRVERRISPSDRRASVTFDSIEVPIDVGFLDPVDELSGWQGRLINLGYLETAIEDEDDPDVRSAVEEFQCNHEMSVTGRCDADTRQKILDVHGV
jgi:hypothetical protein